MMLRLLFAAAVLLVGLAAAEPQVLDSETYASVTTTGKWLVEFYAPWCTHCQKLEPVWNELSDKFEAEQSAFQVAKVDCTVAKEVCEKAGVKGFPTIMYVSQDTRITFKGSRTLEEFVAFSQRVTEDPIKPLVSTQEFAALSAKANAKFFLLALGSENQEEDATRRSTFESAARQMLLESSFYVVGAGDASLQPGIYSFKDGEAVAYSGELTQPAVVAWAKREKFPRFFQLTREIANDIEEPLVCMAVIRPDADNSALFSAVDHVAKVGNEGSAWPCRFVWMDATGEWKSFVESRFGFYAEDLPRFVVYSVRTASYYEHPTGQPFTIDSVTALLHAIIAGTAEAKGGRGLVQDIKNYFNWLAHFLSTALIGAYNEYPTVMQLAAASILLCVVVFVRSLMRPKQAVHNKAE